MVHWKYWKGSIRKICYIKRKKWVEASIGRKRGKKIVDPTSEQFVGPTLNSIRAPLRTVCGPTLNSTVDPHATVPP